MSWHFSQALVGEFLEGNSSDGELFVQSSGSHIPSLFLHKDRMTAFSRLSQSGMIFVPLMESLGEELLTWYLEDFLAKTSVQQEKEQELPENEAQCGSKCSELSEKYNQDLFSLKTAPHLRTKGLTVVLQGLAEAGYDAKWCVLSAKDCGANHERKRMWILATNTHLYVQSISAVNAEAQGLQRACEVYEESSHTNLSQCKGGWLSCGGEAKHPHSRVGAWWQTTPGVHTVDDGVAFGMDRLKAIGNGQVPIVAATAFVHLMSLHLKENVVEEQQNSCKDDTGNV